MKENLDLGFVDISINSDVYVDCDRNCYGGCDFCDFPCVCDTRN